jgi:hypothetical protein
MTPKTTHHRDLGERQRVAEPFGASSVLAKRLTQASAQRYQLHSMTSAHNPVAAVWRVTYS